MMCKCYVGCTYVLRMVYVCVTYGLRMCTLGVRMCTLGVRMCTLGVRMCTLGVRILVPNSEKNAFLISQLQ